MNPTKNILKNHLKSLNTSFLQWYDMFHGTSLSEFAWNSQTQLIEGNDQVSDHLITVSVRGVTFYFVIYLCYYSQF